MLELPIGFQKQMKEMLGSEYDGFVKSLEVKPNTTIRINPFKYNPETSSHPFIRGISTCTQDILWCNLGYSLESRPEFVLDPLYHAGCYYPQESSSMFITQFLLDLDPNKPLKVLDLCAAPGGKSTLLLSYLPKDSLLVSNEIDPLRARILKDNLIRFGSASSVVTSNKVEDFAPFHEFFDLILVDAPCSGEGMMAKEDEAIRQWSPELIASCARTQKQITNHIWNCLAVGGRMIYSTCTYNRQENEEVVESILENNKAELFGLAFGGTKSPRQPAVATPHEGNSMNQIKSFEPNQYHFFSHRAGGLGFFAAGITKKESNGIIEANNIGTKFKGKDPLYFKSFLPEPKFRLNPELYETVARDNALYNIPKLWKSEIVELLKNLKVIKFGVEIGQWKGADWFPSHELALSYDFQSEGLFQKDKAPQVNRHSGLDPESPTTEVESSNKTHPKIDLNYIQAISYLKKEAIEFEEIHSQAENDKPYWALATFQNQTLGWFKVIQGKPKNYLPTDRRIRQN